MTTPGGWKPALVRLVIAAGALAWVSEILVGAVEPVIETLGVSEFFLGLILIPIIGNLAEHVVAIQLAAKNRMDFSM
ncbi:MAG: cation transporter, partial [Candidatus Eisenbacteria bacterium]